MTIYFAFSDESGNYKQYRNIQFNQENPYYIRASFLMFGEQWLYLDYLFRELKDEINLPQHIEVKYSDIQTLINYRKNPPRRINERLLALMEYRNEVLINFISKSLNLLQKLQDVDIILTISKNNAFGTVSNDFIYKAHIQNLMQRIEKELKITDDDDARTDNLCLIFIDPVSTTVNNLLTNTYNDLFCNGDFFTEFSTIKDCLHFEYSHHSCGIQIADFIAGVTKGFLDGRPTSTTIFNQKVRPLLRTCPNGDVMGCGIINIPSNPEVRQYLSETFNVH
jgi:hypothetical protein